MKKIFLLLTSLFTAGSMMANSSDEIVFSTETGFGAITIKTAGTASTGGDYEFSQGNVTVTGTKGYINNKKCTVYKDGTMEISAGGATVDSVKITYASSCYPFAELLAGGSTKDKTSAITSAVYVPSSSTTSVSFSNQSAGKTELKNMTVYYTADGSGSGNELTTACVLIDDASKAKVMDSSYKYLVFTEGKADVAPGDFMIMGVSGYTLNKVEKNNAKVDVSYGYYEVNLVAGDTLKISANYDPEKATVTFIAGNEGAGNYITRISHSGATDPQYTSMPTESFKAVRGFMLYMSYNGEMKLDSMFVDGKLQSYAPSYVDVLDTAVTVKVYAHAYATYNATINITDPAVATVHKGGSSYGDVVTLVAGENAISVPENNKTIVVVPNSGKTIVVKQNGTEVEAQSYSGYFYVDIADGDVISIAEFVETPVVETINLTADMYHQWTSDDASATITSTPVYPAYALNESTGLVYGDGNVYYLNYADLSEYKQLIITSTEGTPRCCFNRAGDNGTVTVETPRDSAYFTDVTEGGVKTTIVDLAAIVKDKGFAHLLCIKGYNWANTTVTSLVLVPAEKEALTGTIAVTEITSTTAIATTTPSDTTTYYITSYLPTGVYARMQAGGYAEMGYTDVADLMTQQVNGTIGRYKEMLGVDLTQEDVCNRGVNELEMEDLDPMTTYTVFALELDTVTKTFMAPFATQEFTTLEAVAVELADSVSIEIASPKWKNAVDTEGWWQISGYNSDSTAYVSLSNSNEISEVAGTYTTSNMDFDYTCLYIANENGQLIKVNISEINVEAKVVDDNYLFSARIVGADSTLYKVSFGPVSDNGGNEYDMQEDVEYAFTAAAETSIAFKEYQGAPYVSISAEEGDKYLSICMDLESNEIPAGTYPINSTYEAGTVEAGDLEDGYVYPTFFATKTEDGYLSTVFLCTGGTMTVSYAEDGTMNLEINATNTWGKAGHFTMSIASEPVEPTIYTCAEAIEARTAGDLADNDSIKVTGYISNMFLKPANFAKYGSVCIWLTDTIGGTAKEFELYNCYGIQGDTLASFGPDFTTTGSSNIDVQYVVGRDGTKVSLGNKVVAAGKIKKYNSTYELNSGCYLVSVDTTTTAIEEIKSMNKKFEGKALINKQVVIRRNNKSYNLNGMIVE